MANELSFNYSTAGSSALVAVLYSGAQIVHASTGALMTDSDANLPDAAIALSDSGHQYTYTGSVPSGATAGVYAVRAYLKGGGSLARSDMASVKGESDAFYWTGSAVGTSGLTASDVWTYASRMLTDGTVHVATPHQVGRIELVRGGSYYNSNSNALTITKGSEFTWPSDVASLPWTVTLYLDPTPQNSGASAPTAVAGTVASASSVRFDLTKAWTSTIVLGPGTGAYKYTVLAATGSGASAKAWLLESGVVDVVDDIATT